MKNYKCLILYSYFVLDGSTRWGIWLFNIFLIYLVNFVILGGCYIKLLVYGDSVPKTQSKEAGLFYQHKKQADSYLKKVCSSLTSDFCKYNQCKIQIHY